MKITTINYQVFMKSWYKYIVQLCVCAHVHTRVYVWYIAILLLYWYWQNMIEGVYVYK